MFRCNMQIQIVSANEFSRANKTLNFQFFFLVLDGDEIGLEWALGASCTCLWGSACSPWVVHLGPEKQKVGDGGQISEQHQEREVAILWAGNNLGVEGRSLGL